MFGVARYVILISSGSAVGPLIAGFMIENTPETWRDFVWLCAALAGFNLLTIFFLYPESSYNRPPLPTPRSPSQEGAPSINKDEGEATCEKLEDASRPIHSTYNEDWVVKVSYPRVWRSFFQSNHRVNLLKAFAVPFVFLLSAPVLWTVFVYGCSLASQIIMMYNQPPFSFLFPPLYRLILNGDQLAN